MADNQPKPGSSGVRREKAGKTPKRGLEEEAEQGQQPAETKKSKTVEVPTVATSNRFTELEDNDNNEEPTAMEDTNAPSHQPADLSKKTTPTPPPLYVFGEELGKHPKAVQRLVRDGARIKHRHDHLQIKLTTPEDYNIVLTYINAQGLRYYTYSPKANKPKKVLLKYLPSDLLEEDIMSDLRQQGLNPLKVENMRDRDRKRSNLFLISFQKAEMSRMMEVRQVEGIHVRVETFANKKGPGQCRRCMRFGHSSECCNMEQRCVACGGPHPRDQCPKTHDEAPECCNCGGQHPASYRGCSAAKEARKPPPKKQSDPARPAKPAPTKTRQNFPKTVGTAEESTTPQKTSGQRKHSYKTVLVKPRRATAPAAVEEKMEVTEEKATKTTTPTPKPKEATVRPSSSGSTRSSAKTQPAKPKAKPQKAAGITTSPAGNTAGAGIIGEILSLLREFDLAKLALIVRKAKKELAKAKTSEERRVVVLGALIELLV